MNQTSTPGVYTYDSSKVGTGSFLPVNDRGYVRENILFNNNSNNYAFTVEVQVSFFYRGGEIFSFSGDDDLWVFVNGKIVPACDLGMRCC